ncbi:MAG: aminotransferase class V-fold PLP-dependent enzyme [Bdellovibrionales bacterium]|nr:aminotransferase class V-fold PLP-dependent enzyme [Bdellovibrionales bacterium]
MFRFDANASSRLRPQVREAVSEYLSVHGDCGANASSIHGHGRRARAALREARASLLEAAGLAGFRPVKAVFCSGGTEACNQMIFGFLPRSAAPGANIVTTAIEHQAVQEAAAAAAELGFELRRVLPQSNGLVAPEDVLAMCDSATEVVCVMAANNVTGALLDVAETARLLRGASLSAAIVCDATQAFGKTELDCAELMKAGVDAVALSAHKVGALPGVGALLLSTSESSCRVFRPMLVGGPQEERFRAGTENLPGIVSFGAAAKAIKAQGAEERSNVSAARDKLWQILNERIDDIERITPDVPHSLGNTLAFRAGGVRGDDLVAALDLSGVAASTGSACSSGRQEASHVFRALGLSEEAAREAVRLSLDWDVNLDQAVAGAEKIIQCVKRMREVSLPLADQLQPTA